MSSFFASFFNGALFDEIVKLVDPTGPKKFVYRDELSTKKGSPGKPSKLKTGDRCLGSSKPLLGEKEEKDLKRNSSPGAAATRATTSEEKAAVLMRVKVKMTRQEAARLLSKCKDGGVLEFKDVARLIAEIPVNRVTVASSAVPSTTRNSVLESIPE